MALKVTNRKSWSPSPLAAAAADIAELMLVAAREHEGIFEESDSFCQFWSDGFKIAIRHSWRHAEPRKKEFVKIWQS